MKVVSILTAVSVTLSTLFSGIGINWGPFDPGGDRYGININLPGTPPQHRPPVASPPAGDTQPPRGKPHRKIKLHCDKEGNCRLPMDPGLLNPQPTNPSETIGESVIEEAILALRTPTLVLQPNSTSVLVNTPVYFYTEPQHLSMDTVIAGFAVRIDATMIAYTWHMGDGTTIHSSTPGTPWPHPSLSHTYTQPQEEAKITLEATWKGTYTINGITYSFPYTLVTSSTSTPINVTQARGTLTR